MGGKEYREKCWISSQNGSVQKSYKLAGVDTGGGIPSGCMEFEMTSDSGQIINLAKIPAIPLEHLGILVVFVGLGTFVPTLGHHLENVDPFMRSNYIMIGLALALYGVFYTCSVPLFGFITDKYNRRKVIIISGLLIMALSFTLIGPWAPLTYLFPNGKGASWAVFLGVCVSGIGTACVNVAAMADCVNEAVSHGLPDSMITYGNLSAMYDTSTGLGKFIGPIIGAAILEHNPYSTLSGVLTGLSLGAAGLLILYCGVVYAALKRSRSRSGYSSIDNNNVTHCDTQYGKKTVRLPLFPCPTIQIQHVQFESMADDSVNFDQFSNLDTSR